MVLVLGLWYLRKADNEFDPLAERAIEAYADDEMNPGGQRFRRERVGVTTNPEPLR